MMNKGMYSSLTPEWATPQALFDQLDAEFNFTLDACASQENAKVTFFYQRESLIRGWYGTVWCNPPYGRFIGDWTRKAWQSAHDGATVVMLVPSRTDTQWWHRDIMRADEIRFIEGRLKFKGAEFNAPFPSAIAVFRPR